VSRAEREPRVARLERDGVSEPVREVFDAFARERGKVPNLFRVAAHRPEIVTTLRAHMNAVMGPGTVDVLLKELVAVRVSQINNCEY
jgi:alkylhydroperoxidase family enzyme